MSGIFDDDLYSVDMEPVDIPAIPAPEGEILISGDSNSPPTVSDNPQQASGVSWGRLGDILGSIGTTARDLGTAVGKTQRDIEQAGKTFQDSRQAAYSGNKLATWWQYASMTDKVMVGLAGVGIAIAIYTAVKK